MRAEELYTLLRRQPFVPFRVHLTDGTAYTIRHPEMAWLARSTLFVVPEDKLVRGIPEDYVLSDILHVVRAELIDGRHAPTP